MIESLLLQAVLLSAHGHVTAPATSPAPLIEREVTTVTFGEADFEEFNVVHVSSPWSQWPLIWVVPLGQGAEYFESTNIYYDSFAAGIAYAGIDLYIHEMRRGTSETLPSFSCPSPFPLPPGAPAPDTDCSGFGTWTLNDIVEDIEYVRTDIVDSWHDPAIGGQWTGAMAAQAVINSPTGNEYTSLIMHEGTMYTDDEVTLGKNLASCNFLKTIPAFLGASHSPGDEWGASQLAQLFPDEESGLPAVVLAGLGLAPGATNLHVIHAVFIANTFVPMSPFPLDRVSEGLIFMTGTIEDGPDQSEMSHVYNITDVDPHSTYAPTRVLQDFACGLGGESEYTWDLDKYEGSVLVIGSDRGLRDELEDTLGEFVSSNHTQSEFYGEFGVHDLFWTTDMRKTIDPKIALFVLTAHHRQ